MPVQSQQYTTVTCDAPECGKTVTFEVTQAGIANEVIEANPWLKTNLVVQTTDKRGFSICSPLCLVKSAQAGLFDPIEVKQIAPVVGGTAAIAAAAAEARRKQIADKNIRDGQPVQVALT